MYGSKGKAARRGTVERAKPASRESRADASAPAVLVADDEPSMLRIAVMLIKDFLPRAKVREAADGYEAARALRSFKPDLLITDLFMPGPDGVQLSAMVRLTPDLEATKVLAITGKNTDETRKDALRGGANEYLAKPFEPQDFKRVVLRLLGIEEPPKTRPRGRPVAQLSEVIDDKEEDENEEVGEHVPELGEPEPEAPPGPIYHEEEEDL